MINKSIIFCILLLNSKLLFANPHILEFKAKDNISKGKQVLLVAGDEEYRSEESMPMLAKILSKHHGFDCKVIFSWGPTGKYIDPNNQTGVIGFEELDNSDLMIIATRFRRPNEKDLAHITKYLNSGKPVIGLRTATHAFTGKSHFGGIRVDEFGLKILGEKWVSHHGKHKKQGARAYIESTNATHPVLNSVKDIFAPSDVYGVKHLTDAATILMRAAVTETLDPSSKNIAGKKNDPMMPFAWLNIYTAQMEQKGLLFCTTAGASVIW